MRTKENAQVSIWAVLLILHVNLPNQPLTAYLKRLCLCNAVIRPLRFKCWKSTTQKQTMISIHDFWKKQGNTRWRIIVGLAKVWLTPATHAFLLSPWQTPPAILLFVNSWGTSSQDECIYWINLFIKQCGLPPLPQCPSQPQPSTVVLEDALGEKFTLLLLGLYFEHIVCEKRTSVHYLHSSKLFVEHIFLYAHFKLLIYLLKDIEKKIPISVYCTF